MKKTTAREEKHSLENLRQQVQKKNYGKETSSVGVVYL